MKTNAYPKEIIGKTIKVIASKNKSNEGMEGKVTDETKKTIVVATKKGEKRLFKNNITIMLNNQKITGKMLMKRPEERIK